jgi:hypothetical protein
LKPYAECCTFLVGVKLSGKVFYVYLCSMFSLINYYSNIPLFFISLT